MKEYIPGDMVQFIAGASEGRYATVEEDHGTHIYVTAMDGTKLGTVPENIKLVMTKRKHSKNPYYDEQTVDSVTTTDLRTEYRVVSRLTNGELIDHGKHKTSGRAGLAAQGFREHGEDAFVQTRQVSDWVIR